MMTVNIEQMGKAARKELTRNPKKTILLGVMCLVALYFWAPLLFGRGEDAPDEVAASEDESLPQPVTASPLAGTTAPAAPTFTWQQLTTWREQDKFAKPASLPPGLRDPFLMAGSAPMGDGVAPGEGSQMQPFAAVATPEALGLQLGGTVVGRRTRAATINGKTYSQGAAVAVRQSDGEEGSDGSGQSAAPVQFTLREVHPSYVVLERDGSVYSLTLKRPEAGDVVRISGG